MNATNRFVNRFFLAVVGVILIAVGVLLIALALPATSAVRTWLDDARSAQDAYTSRWSTGLSAPFDGSALPWEIAAGCAVIVLLGLITVGIRGGGRTDRVVDADDTAGDIVVSSRFAESALVAALEPHRDLTSVSATTFRVRGEPAVRLRLRVAAGVSPVSAVAAASEAVRGLDAVLGESPLPVLVEVTGASAPRPGADSRVR